MKKNYKDTVMNLSKTTALFEGAKLSGSITTGEHVGIWFNAVLRGDMAPITIGDNTNIQDNAVVHTNTDMPTTIGNNVTVGHSAIVHAAHVEDDALIGMGSIILDGATVKKGAFVAAGTIVPPGKTVPENTLVMGNPMKIVKALSDEDRAAMRKNKDSYVTLKDQYT